MHKITIIKNHEDNTKSTHLIEDFQVNEFEKFTKLYRNFENVHYHFSIIEDEITEVRITIETNIQPPNMPVDFYCCTFAHTSVDNIIDTYIAIYKNKKSCCNK